MDQEYVALCLRVCIPVKVTLALPCQVPVWSGTMANNANLRALPDKVVTVADEKLVQVPKTITKYKEVTALVDNIIEVCSMLVNKSPRQEA